MSEHWDDPDLQVIGAFLDAVEVFVADLDVVLLKIEKGSTQGYLRRDPVAESIQRGRI